MEEGTEQRAAECVRRVAGDAARDVFVLQREVPRHSKGTWAVERDVAYPGCVFVEVADAEALRNRLEGAPATRARLIRNGRDISLLAPKEARLLLDLGGADHVVRMSVGDVVEGQLVVRSGSLAGHEALIAHVDRHRRSAWLVANPPARGLRVGLEVVSKS